MLEGTNERSGAVRARALRWCTKGMDTKEKWEQVLSFLEDDGDLGTEARLILRSNRSIYQSNRIVDVLSLVPNYPEKTKRYLVETLLGVMENGFQVLYPKFVQIADALSEEEAVRLHQALSRISVRGPNRFGPCLREFTALLESPSARVRDLAETGLEALGPAPVQKSRKQPFKCAKKLKTKFNPFPKHEWENQKTGAADQGG